MPDPVTQEQPITLDEALKRAEQNPASTLFAVFGTGLFVGYLTCAYRAHKKLKSERGKSAQLMGERDRARQERDTAYMSYGRKAIERGE